MHFPQADNFYVLLPIHSPTSLQVLNKNGGPVQHSVQVTDSFKVGTGSQTELFFSNVLYCWLSCEL